MLQVAVSVEGQTEERFVKRVLQPFFCARDIYIEPIIVNTKRTPTGFYKGGSIKFDKAIRELKLLLNPKYSLVTTFYDYYGLDETFLPRQQFDDPYLMINKIEENISTTIGNPKFLPYIQLHEFEAFLFIDSNVTCNNLLNCNRLGISNSINNAMSTTNNNPELINNSRATAPSKRIIQVYAGYQKTLDGPGICEELGIQKIINSCPNFKKWIDNILDLTKE